MMKLWLLLVVALGVLGLWLRTKRSPSEPRRRQLKTGQKGPEASSGEIEVRCPGCGHDAWQVWGRLSPRAVVLRCQRCGRSISFVGEMERVDHRPTQPKEG